MISMSVYGVYNYYYKGMFDIDIIMFDVDKSSYHHTSYKV